MLRENRLVKFTEGNNVGISKPLLKELRLTYNLFIQIKNAVSFYIYESLVANGCVCGTTAGIIPSYRDKILKLPNRTPNGLILPKRENYLSYNILHKTIAKVLEHFKLPQHIDKIHSPINIRAVDICPNPEVDNRPRSSTKWHSDVWAGEFTNTTMVFIPIYGNYELGGIEFCEPNYMFFNMIKPLDDYLDGLNTVNLNTIYNDVQLNIGGFYLTDPYLLHRTIKKGVRQNDIRLSLDFRFISKYKAEGDTIIDSPRIANYIDYSRWKNLLLYSDKSLEEFEEVSKNEYSGNYTFLDPRCEQ